jgi:hypothetical protein
MVKRDKDFNFKILVIPGQAVRNVKNLDESKTSDTASINS